MFAILISEQAGEPHFDAVKRFVQDNINNCMGKPEGERPSAVYILDPNRLPGGGMSGRCSTQECIDEAFSHICYSKSSLDVSTPLSQNGNETADAARLAVGLLRTEAETSRHAEGNSIFLFISDYVSVPFAHAYDSDQGFRRDLSTINFQINVVNAPVDYYKIHSSIPNYYLYSFNSFEELEGHAERLCPPANEGIHIFSSYSSWSLIKTDLNLKTNFHNK